MTDETTKVGCIYLMAPRIGNRTPLVVKNASSLHQGKIGLFLKQQETSKKCRLLIHYIENECDQQAKDQNSPTREQIMQSFFHMINSWPKIPKCGMKTKKGM